MEEEGKKDISVKEGIVEGGEWDRRQEKVMGRDYNQNTSYTCIKIFNKNF